MKIVILGGTGNISASIVKRLLEKGHEVTCYNRGQSGAPHPEVRVIHGDRRERQTFERTMQAEQFDAAIDMISFSKEDALSSLAAFRGVKQFIQCSTVCAYGVAFDWLPVTEDHPLRPITGYGKGKAEADRALLGAYYNEGFPVTIIRPSTTYGPQMGLIRQVAWDFSWLDRIRKGKPILVCGDGMALHQFLHVDDAAKGFAGVIGNERCIGQVYNLVNRGYATWEDYHRTAMQLLGNESDLVGVPLQNLIRADAQRFAICQEIFAHPIYMSSDKIFRDVPEFIPTVSLKEGMRLVIEAMTQTGRIPDSDQETWEDRLIAAFSEK